MSMEISGNYRDYKNDYLERLQCGKDKEIEKEQGEGNKSESIPIPKDEYISSGKSGSRPSGLYRMGQDENGSPKCYMMIQKNAVLQMGTDSPKSNQTARKIMRRNALAVPIRLTGKLKN